MEIRPLEFRTRFLYPFAFEAKTARGRAADEPAGSASDPLELAASTLAGVRLENLKDPDGLPLALWSVDEAPPGLYSDEILPAVHRFLFGSRVDKAATESTSGLGCRYLRFRSETANRLLANAVADVGGGIPLTVDPNAGIEVFLTDQGIGIFSISLRVLSEQLPANSVLDFNYRLSQVHPRMAGRVRQPHPSEDPSRWERIPPGVRAGVRPAPARDARPGERVARPGGEFTLFELVTLLVLDPLGARMTMPDPDWLDRGFYLYTVVRFGSEVDFSNEEVRIALGPLLAALTQVEEPSHAGSVPDLPTIQHVLLNRRHWAGVARMGTAHLLADQPPPEGRTDHPFNHERVQRIVLKYFVPYVLSLLQHLVLRRAEGIACTQMLKSRAPTRSITDLRSQLLEFQLGGSFAQVSRREVVQRYYDLSLSAIGVDRDWSEVKRSFAEFYTHDLNSGMGRNLLEVANVQNLLEVLEVVVISYYLTELGLKMLEPWDNHLFIVADGKCNLLPLSLFLVFAACTTGFIKLWNRQRRKRDS